MITLLHWVETLPDILISIFCLCYSPELSYTRVKLRAGNGFNGVNYCMTLQDGFVVATMYGVVATVSQKLSQEPNTTVILILTGVCLMLGFLAVAIQLNSL